MRKKKRFALFSLLLVGLFGIGTASAFIVNNAATLTHSGEIEGAIVLDWGTENETTAITDLVPSTPQYRKISVAAPQKSANVTLTPTFSAELVNGDGVAEKTVSLRGVKVEFANATWLQSEPPTAISELTVDWTGGTGSPGDWTPSAGGKDNKNNPGASTVTITAATTYWVKITISQEAFNYYADATKNYELSGKLVFSYKAV